MSEALNEQRQIFLSKQNDDCHVTFFPPLSDEEKVNFPQDPSDPMVPLDRILDNGSQVLVLPEYALAWNWKNNLLEFADKVANHLGDYILDKTIYNMHPDRFFADRLEPVMITPSPQYL